MKLKRNAHRFYVMAGSNPWYLVGKGIEDLSVAMNGTFEAKKDVLGETSVEDSGYQPQVSVEPYYADPTDDIYEFLLDLALNRKSGDDAKAKYLEVMIEDIEATKHAAWQEDCRIEIVSYGGDTSGFQIAYNVWPDGNRVKGDVSYEGKTPTFTPAV